MLNFSWEIKWLKLGEGKFWLKKSTYLLVLLNIYSIFIQKCKGFFLKSRLPRQTLPLFVNPNKLPELP